MTFRIFLLVLIFLIVKNDVWAQSAKYLSVPNVEDLHVYEDISETHRLPNNTRPTHYDVHLRTWINEGIFTFEGRVAISIDVLQRSNTIVLHQGQLNITTFELENLSGEVLPVLMTYVPIQGFLIFELSAGDLQEGEEYVLRINYTGILRTDGYGFYRSSYLNDDGDEVWYATTQFEPTYAREAFPCFDEPALKARFLISITHDPSYWAVSNMPASGQQPNPDGSVTTSFEETGPTSTYVLAFIVSDFEVLSNENGGVVPHRTLARPNAIHLTEFGLNIGVELLDILVDFIGVDNAMQKMDQVSVSEFPHRIGFNFALLTYSESAFLYDINSTAVSTEAVISALIGHQLAHQWFGNLVSPRWWTYLWLNEGFAHLLGNTVVNLMYPNWNHLEYYVSTTRYSTLRSDARSNTHPMSHYIETREEIYAVFNYVAAGKAALVLRMFAQAYSISTFVKGVRYFLAYSQFSDASENELFSAIDIASLEDNVILPPNAGTEVLMGSWTQQTGYPIITVTRNYNATENVTFTQRRFMTELYTMPDNSIFWVPIFLGLPSDPSNEIINHPILWLSSAEENHQISELTNADWLIVNKYGSGFYRVLYDRQNYQLLKNALSEDILALSTNDRASLIDDLYIFAENELVTYDVFFDFIEYMEDEHFYEPWYVTTQALTTILRRFDGQANNEILRDFLRSLFEFYFEYTGIDDEDGEHRMKKYSRSLAISWACHMGTSTCRRDTNLALKSIIASNGEFHQNLRNVLYCAALRSGDIFDYVFVWNRLLASNDQAYRDMLINALGCTPNNGLLHDLLNSSLNSTNSGDFEYRPGEHIRIFNAVYQSGIQGLNIALSFLRSNLEEAALTFGRNNIGGLVIGIAERITLYTQSTEFGLLLHSALSQNYIDIGVVEQALNITNANQLWFYQHQSVIATWLTQNYRRSRSG